MFFILGEIAFVASLVNFFKTGHFGLTSPSAPRADHSDQNVGIISPTQSPFADFDTILVGLPNHYENIVILEGMKIFLSKPEDHPLQDGVNPYFFYFGYDYESKNKECFGASHKPHDLYNLPKLAPKKSEFNSAFPGLLSCYAQSTKTLPNSKNRFLFFISETPPPLVEVDDGYAAQKHYFDEGELNELIKANSIKALYVYTLPKAAYNWYSYIRGLHVMCGAVLDLIEGIKQGLPADIAANVDKCLKTELTDESKNRLVLIDSITGMIGGPTPKHTTLRPEKFILTYNFLNFNDKNFKIIRKDLEPPRSDNLQAFDFVYQNFLEGTFSSGRAFLGITYEDHKSYRTKTGHNTPFHETLLHTTNLLYTKAHTQLLYEKQMPEDIKATADNFHATVTNILYAPERFIGKDPSSLVRSYFKNLVQNFGCNVFYNNESIEDNDVDLISQARFGSYRSDQFLFQPINFYKQLSYCFAAYWDEYKFYKTHLQPSTRHREVSIVFLFPRYFKNIVLSAFASDILQNPLFRSLLSRFNNTRFHFSSGAYSGKKEMKSKTAAIFDSQTLHEVNLEKVWIPFDVRDESSTETDPHPVYDLIIQALHFAADQDTSTAFDKRIIIAFAEDEPLGYPRNITASKLNRITTDPANIIIVTPDRLDFVYRKTLKSAGLDGTIVSNFNNLGVALFKEITAILASREI